MSIESKLGCGRACPKCVKRLSGPALLTGSLCGWVKLDHDANPVTEGLTGDRADCIGFEPNMATSLRDLATSARMFVNSVGSSLPPV